MLLPEKMIEHSPSKEQHALPPDKQSLNQSRETAMNLGREVVALHSHLQGLGGAAKSPLSLRIPQMPKAHQRH